MMLRNILLFLLSLQLTNVSAQNVLPSDTSGQKGNYFVRFKTFYRYAKSRADADSTQQAIIDSLRIISRMMPTASSAAKWNTAYSWGNHAGLYKLANYTTTWTEITGRPNFAIVASTGSYLDLVDRPAIPGVAGLLSSIDAANTYQPKGNYLTSAPYQVKLWSRTAQLSTVAIEVADTFSISGATATINLPLPTGTTTARLKSITAYRASATASNAPHAAVTGFTNTSVSVIVTQANATTINLVGLVNLNLIPIITIPDPQNVKLIISYACY